MSIASTEYHRYLVHAILMSNDQTLSTGWRLGGARRGEVYVNVGTGAEMWFGPGDDLCRESAGAGIATMTQGNISSKIYEPVPGVKTTIPPFDTVEGELGMSAPHASPAQGYRPRTVITTPEPFP